VQYWAEIKKYCDWNWTVQYCAEMKKIILRMELKSTILRRNKKNIANGTKECNIAQK
jgi:hypothetical protein